LVLFILRERISWILHKIGVALYLPPHCYLLLVYFTFRLRSSLAIFLNVSNENFSQQDFAIHICCSPVYVHFEFVSIESSSVQPIYKPSTRLRGGTALRLSVITANDANY
jgi:hypothetical protein